jgi:16S rRNA processing protein RimM
VYIHIGKIVASFGINGELIIEHGMGKVDLKKATALFVEPTKGSYLPYFIERIKHKSDSELYVKLEDVNTKEAVKPLMQKKVWLTETDFRKVATKNSAISLLKYEVFDGKTSVGTVEAVIEQPHQILLQVPFGTEDALLPLHQETLVNIDHTQKKIYLNLPDGLLDIYR